MCHVSSADPVLPDRLSRAVRRRLALRLLFRVALLPNKLHGHAGHLFLKLLRSGELFFIAPTLNSKMRVLFFFFPHLNKTVSPVLKLTRPTRSRELL